IPLCLPSSVSFIGTPQECEKAHFVPGYNLGGEGFDIVTMERKGAYVIDTETWKIGNGNCRMYCNRYMNGEKQKVPVAVVDWRTLPKCSLKVSSVVYDSVETLVSDSTSSVSNNWTIGLDVPVDPSAKVGVGLGGSHSRDSTFAMKKSKQDRYTFLHHSINCKFYGYRLATSPPLSQEFKSALDIPPYSSKTAPLYHNLIDTYGTHYITQVSLGGEIKATTATDGSVEVTYGDQKKRTDIISNDDNPRWRETFEFGTITINMKNKLKFSVYDEDSYWNSDLLGECSFDLRAGKVSDSCMLNHGTFFFSYIVECAPSLSGNQCQEYIPSAMSPSLAEVFHTRNGVLLGKMGNKYEKPANERL
uniref:Perforin 1.2 n=1 Tax=Haplochromis burtoni TaxID=8153 RepID=A0A3Q2WRP2_HAPBU